MNRFLLFFILPAVALAMCACDDDSSDLDTTLIKGQWEVIEPQSEEFQYFYDFTTDSENTWSWGEAITFWQFAGGMIVNDKQYDWHVDDPDNSDPVYLDLVLTGEINSVADGSENRRYVVKSLSATEMVLVNASYSSDMSRLVLKRVDSPIRH